MLTKMLEGLGKIDPETRMLFARFVVRASKSGDANRFIKLHLQRILSEAESEAVDVAGRGPG